MTTFASARERNHSRLRHSSRNLPLKLSATPFCQGLPGSINAVPIPASTIQDNSAFDTNSGPLSLRRKRRRAALADQTRQHLDHARRADAAVDVDRQPLLGELVGHGQALELLAVGAAVEHEVVGPHLVRPRSAPAGAAAPPRRASSAACAAPAARRARHSRQARPRLIRCPSRPRKMRMRR